MELVYITPNIKSHRICCSKSLLVVSSSNELDKGLSVVGNSWGGEDTDDSDYGL